jgi:hypothetical protein
VERYIDLSHEVTKRTDLDNRILAEKAWLARDLHGFQWVIPLNSESIMEIDTMISLIKERPLPLVLRSPEEFEIPHLRAIYAEAKVRLDTGIGFAVLDKFPIEWHSIEDIVSIYWVLGQLLGPAVAQKWDGTMIYDVIDTKKKYGYGVRGSVTNVELVFHNDNAFVIRVPDYVGLLCKYPAKEGGLSRFCSLYSLHQRMVKNFPKQLDRLYQPMLFDRQAEHSPEAPKITFAPFFSLRHGKLKCRANTSLVRKGYEVAGVSMDADLSHGNRSN